MSSIPEMLKDAYDKKDWNIVSGVYLMLTGTRLDDSIHQPQKRQEPKYEMPTAPDSNKKYARTEQIDTSKSKVNLFVDDGTEAIEDRAIDKILCKNGPLPRTKTRNEMINVKCRKCGRISNVNKVLVSGNKYVCDNCIGHP